MASQIEQTIRNLITLFNELAEAGDIPKQTVTKVNKALDSLATGKNAVTNIDNISRSLATLKSRLQNLGGNNFDKDIQSLRSFLKEIEDFSSYKVAKLRANVQEQFSSAPPLIGRQQLQSLSDADKAMLRLQETTKKSLDTWKQLKDVTVQPGTYPAGARVDPFSRVGVTQEGQKVSPAFGVDESTSEVVRRISIAAEKYASVEGETNRILRDQIGLQERRLSAVRKVAELNSSRGVFRRLNAREDDLSVQEILYGERAPGDTRQKGLGGKKAQFETVSDFTSVIGNARQVSNFTEAVQKLNLEGARITSVWDDAASGIRTINLEAAGAGGIMRRATVRMNEHGQVVSDLSTRYQGFGRAISNNVVKVLNWAIALGVVYGSLNRIRELMTQTIDIQRELTEVQIATGQSVEQLGRVFEQASVIAKQTGSSITGVIEGSTEAYAAAGSIEDPAERSAAAQILLRDSMILAKLAGLEQAQALDILNGALRQSGRSLESGLELIDKFVAVSKEANVSINTLASTYAIVGTAAEDVGLSLDELNALAATLAESTKLSADETGNAIRGFVSGFQSASAEQALSQFGIAVRDSNGHLRDFRDLTEQIVQLNQQGVISDRSLAEISNIVGGGFRRGSQFATFLENYPRFNALTQVSEFADGDASSALDLQLSTLETSITKLGNAFTHLAQTLGEDGGFVSLMTSLTNIFSGLLGFIDRLISGLGKATPYLLTFGAALAIINSNQGQSFLERQALPGFLSRAVTGGATGATYGNALDVYRRTASGAIQGSVLTQNVARYAPSIIGAGIVAGGAVAEGDYNKAGASIAGAIAGTLIGGPVGTILGSIIGSSIYETLVNYDIDIIGRRIALAFDQQKSTLEDKPEDLAAQFEESLTTGEKFRAGITSLFANAFLDATKFSAGLFGVETGLEDSTFKFKPEDFLQRFGEAGELNPESLRLLQLLSAAGAVQAVEQGLTARDVDDKIKFAADELEPLIQARLQDYLTQQLTKLGRGEITPSDFTGSKELISRLGEQGAIISVGLDIADLGDLKPEELIELLLALKDEERTFVTSIVGEIIDLQNKIDALNIELPGTTPDVQDDIIQQIDKLTEERNQASNKLEEALPAIKQSATVRAAREQLLPIIDVSGISPEQVQAVIALGEKLQIEYFKELGLSDETAALIIESNQEQIIRLLDKTGQQFLGRTQVGEDFLGLAGDILGTPFGGGAQADPFSLLDLRGRLPIAGLQGRYNAFRDQLTSIFPQLQPDESEFGVIADDGFGTLHADMSILNLLMEELIDVNRDQLNGIYNLPTDATFFVPFTGALLDAQTRSLMAGLGSVVGENSDAVTNAVEQATTAIGEDRREFSNRDARLAHEFGPEPAYDKSLYEVKKADQEIDALRRQYELRLETEGDPYRKSKLTAIDAANQAVDSVQEIITKFQLSIESTTTLILDGRQLAAAISQYLYEDLIRTEGGATVVRTFVV